jgi:DNA primase
LALNLDKIDVADFLNELGMNNVREEGKDVWYSCFSDAHYRGDANPSASMEKGTTRFFCFSCGMSGNAVTFLAELENVSPIQAAIWIKERFGGVGTPDRKDILENVKDILSKKGTQHSGSKNKELQETEVLRRKIDWKSAKAWLQYSGDLIDSSDTAIIYMFDRGFVPEVLDKFEIGWDKISERICIPVRDAEKNLVGFKGRAIDNKEPKYMVLGGPEYGFDPYLTKHILFGLPQILNSKKYQDTGEIILCEGELKCYRNASEWV